MLTSKLQTVQWCVVIEKMRISKNIQAYEWYFVAIFEVWWC